MKPAGLKDGDAMSLSLASALKESEACRSFDLCGELNIPNPKFV